MAELESEDVPSIRPPAGARALNTLTIGAIAVAIGLVAIAAVPAWMKTSPSAAAANEVPAPVHFRPEGLPPPVPHPSFVEDDDERAEAERGFPESARPRGLPGGHAVPDLDRSEPEGPGSVRLDRGSTQVRIGTARHATPLLAEPGSGGAALGQLAANEPVRVVKEQGEWAFVIRGGFDARSKEMGAGWIKKSELAIR